MKLKLILCLALMAFDRSSSARVVRMWSDAELMAASDLVVIGQPVETKDLAETNALGFSSTESFQSRFRGVETTFKISAVLKGTQVGNQVVLHHYRFEWGSPPNGPSLVEFNRGDTNEYLLYLKNDEKNRYASVTGQMDPTIKLWSAHNSGDTKFTKQIFETLNECQKIKPGMTRADLLKVFTTEGGFSTAVERTYVYRGCPYIKADVSFTAADPKQNLLEEHPTDVISKISKPYLDWSIGD
jgi:hypothetical protein